ncbi:MAG: efflux RND transporter permease subunit [Peptococcaceae bacterium]|jgi:multidrug efflux pump subunit AcrB|nr:efflux RND transporter permease subunit [Peptococcaceae bacterium]
MTSSRKLGLAGRIANLFINSKLTPVLVVATVFLGLFAVATTPQQKDPQIVVPMIEIFVPFHGAGSKEVERLVTDPLEKIMWGIKGVHYVYSESMPGESIITVRFAVGANLEDSLVKVYNQVFASLDKIPPGVGQPLIQSKSIDNVPVAAITFWSSRYNSYQLRQIATTVADEVNRIKDVYQVKVLGGEPRQITVLMDPNKLTEYHVSPLEIAHIISSANWNSDVGSVSHDNVRYTVQSGGFLNTASEVGSLVVGVYDGRPVYLSSVARISDGPARNDNYVLFGQGRRLTGQAAAPGGAEFPAVTLTVSELPDANAVTVCNDVINKVDLLKGSIVPAGVHLTITRNSGQAAASKAHDLIEHMIIAIVSVFLLIWVVLGFREALVVGVALPVTLSIALFLSQMYGYTLNRVTLFALIFAIGILVDDAIVVVENIHRWCHLSEAPTVAETLAAVDEVGNPTVLATLTVITMLLPMAFVSGMMGPYMRPIPVNSSVAMFFSLLVAFAVTPWFSVRLLRTRKTPLEACDRPVDEPGRFRDFYRRTVGFLLDHRWARYAFALSLVVLLGASFLLVSHKAVVLKMLPDSNQNEFQVLIKTKDGTTLAQTAAVTRSVCSYVAGVSEVDNYVAYVGVPAPINFNGLVRWYDIQHGPNLATIQVDLVNKKERYTQSHQLVLEMRPHIDAIAAKYGARVTMVEIPPGPPTLSPLGAEIYGRNWSEDLAVARQVKTIFSTTPGVVDVDWMVNHPQPQINFVPNSEAQIHGISNQTVAQTVDTLINGSAVGLLHTTNSIDPVKIVLDTSRADRSNIDTLLHSFTLPAGDGSMVPLYELVNQKTGLADQPIFHENLNRVIYVVANVSEPIDSPIYSMFAMVNRIGKIKTTHGNSVPQLFFNLPTMDKNVSIKWGGEWTITYEVFRDLGIAFVIGLLIMYLLMVAWFKSFVIPVIIMASIPVSLIGIIPGHLFLGVFFTATSMIGFMAVAGIVVRNSILLVEFTYERMAQGIPLKNALIDAGLVRARPIILTAAAVIVSSFVIILDPVFTGMAVSLIFGIVSSTILTLFLTPVLLYAHEKRRGRKAGAE